MKQLSQIILVIACALPVTGRCFAAQDPAPTADERLEALNKETRDVYDAWAKEISAKARAAEAKGEELPRSAYTPPFKPFVAKYQAAASDFAKTDDAIPFLTWLVRRGMDVDAAAGKQAMTTLVDDHLESKKFERLASMLPGMQENYEEKEYLALLQKVEKNSTNPMVRAWAVLARLSETLDSSDVGSEAFEAAKKEMRAAMEGVDDRYLSSQVGQKIDVRERFSIGMVSPDIEGIDLDGEAFKLSDYSGKVIFLDFWGNW